MLNGTGDVHIPAYVTFAVCHSPKFEGCLETLHHD